MIDTMKALGAKPVPMAFEEVYSALQTGVIDGAENNPPSYLETSHYEVAKYFSLDEHAMVPEIVLMSLKTWNKLSEEDRDIIKRAALEGQEYEIKLWIDLELKALEEVKAAGCTIIHPDKKPFMDIVEPIYEKYGKEYEELIEGIKAT
jgi:TRAP-type C4-dicarboxylate transport system substrate-binding protein